MNILHPDWKKILLKAWSIRFMAFGLVLQVPNAIAQAAPNIAPYLPGIATFIFNLAAAHPLFFASLSILSFVGALLTRVMPQKEFSNGA